MKKKILMGTSRRLWLKNMGIGVAGIGLAPLHTFASPAAAANVQGSIEDDADLILLRSNENPYGPSPLARKAFANNTNSSNRYQWDTASILINDLAKKNNVTDDNVLLGAGSTEILDLVAKYVSLEKGNYVIADPSYDYWAVILDNLGFQKLQIPVTLDKKVDLSAMQKAINQDTKLVYICNPNNPTSTVCERTELVHFIQNTSQDITILVDEAYLEFTNQQSVKSLIDKHSNLIVAKTFSKIYGLAGARIGYALASKATIEKLTLLQSSPNGSVSVLSRLAAIASLKDAKFVDECSLLNKEVRRYTMDALQKLGFECIESNTNFIYFATQNYKKDYFKQLEDHHVQGTRLYEDQGKWTRISVGTLKEMQQFIKALQ